MTFSQNVHPDEKWVKIDAMVWGQIDGGCLRLVLADSKDQQYNLIIHYGREKNKNEFVLMVKEAISKIPVQCITCGQIID